MGPKVPAAADACGAGYGPNSPEAGARRCAAGRSGLRTGAGAGALGGAAAGAGCATGAAETGAGLVVPGAAGRSARSPDRRRAGAEGGRRSDVACVATGAVAFGFEDGAPAAAGAGGRSGCATVCIVAAPPPASAAADAATAAALCAVAISTTS
jgi:hypothetical protein